jgi:hypothetical protein
MLFFSFAFTNAAPGQVVIESVRTSCGCTVAKVPTLPWVIPPGGDGEFSVTLDLRGKRGTVTKSVFVNTSMGTKPLTVRAIVPDNGTSGGSGGGMDDRLRNMQIALADRTAIFRGDCASCHATPATAKQGPALYLAACAICHDSHNRASMVPGPEESCASDRSRSLDPLDQLWPTRLVDAGVFEVGRRHSHRRPD